MPRIAGTALTEAQKMRIRDLYACGVKQPQLADRFGVSAARISQVLSEKEAV